MITTTTATTSPPKTEKSRDEECELHLPPRMERGLISLLEARDYARDLQTSIWDFAMELASLRELQLTKSDLRWMLGRGLVEQGIEVTLMGDTERSFRQPMRPLFSRRACFVLTPAGAAMARELRGETDTRSALVMRSSVVPPWPAPTAATKLLPKWDRDRQELKVGTILVKRFRVPAANQEAILAAFEEESWPARIDDPLPPHHEQSPKRRLQETIKSLNRNQKQGLIRFLGDGSGQGVRWEFAEPDGLSEI